MGGFFIYIYPHAAWLRMRAGPCKLPASAIGKEFPRQTVATRPPTSSLSPNIDTQNDFQPLSGGSKTRTMAIDNEYEATDLLIDCNSNHEVESFAEHSNSPISKAVPREVTSQSALIVEQVLQKATYAQLLDHVPGNILDRVVAERLKNASATQILKWLAEAQRLGYKEDDIFDDEDESFMPNLQSGVDQRSKIRKFRSSGSYYRFPFGDNLPVQADLTIGIDQIDRTIENNKMEWMYDRYF
jgi:hypothetical protein